MAIKSVTPKMTSHTTPEPYRVYCSSERTIYHPAWKAFDNIVTGEYDYWHSEERESEWIAIDFGSATGVSGVWIVSVSRGWLYVFEKFEVHGSMDGEEWEVISRFEGYPDVDPNTKKIFSFGRVVYYRYYRIYVIDHHNSYVTIREINFVCDSDLNDLKLDFHKTLSKNVPDFLEGDKNEIHFTEKGEIFVYDMLGNRVQLGNLDSNIFKSSW